MSHTYTCVTVLNNEEFIYTCIGKILNTTLCYMADRQTKHYLERLTLNN